MKRPILAMLYPLPHRRNLAGNPEAAPVTRGVCCWHAALPLPIDSRHEPKQERAPHFADVSTSRAMSDRHVGRMWLSIRQSPVFLWVLHARGSAGHRPCQPVVRGPEDKDDKTP